MAYFRKYRRVQAELAAILKGDSHSKEESHSKDDPFTPVLSSEISHTENNSLMNDAKNVLYKIDCHNNDKIDYTTNLSEQDTSSDPEFCYSDEDNVNSKGNQTLSQDLSVIVSKYNLPRLCTNELLAVLRKHGHILPKDARTLLKTPKQFECKEMCEGSYIYFGIKSAIKKQLQILPNYTNKNNKIELCVNVDGVPLFKSSKIQIWPILGLFYASNVFMIALYCGKSKPSSASEYLREFISEINLLESEGITYESCNYEVSIKSFICDAPARSFLKGTIGHTGFYSCERCEIKGSYVDSRVVFNNDEDFPPRNMTDFNNFNYKNTHQHLLSPLVHTQVNCVNDFVLDYMHLVCLGVVKRLLMFLKNGPRLCKLSSMQIKAISDHLLALNGKLPSEFARQPRSLDELKYWKATEFRQFLLYTGLIVLKGVVSKNIYQHFLALSVAMRILLNENIELRMHYLNFAHSLLAWFVKNSKHIYGGSFCVYNVHSLLHIDEDVINMQCSLNDVSAFPFENYMRVLKNFVRNSKNPIVQVSKRQAEFESITYQIQVSKVNRVSTCFRDSVFQIENGFCFVKEKRDSGYYVCSTFKFNQLESLFEIPLHSKDLNIGCVSNFNSFNMASKVLHRSQLLNKVVVLPYKFGFAFFPLIHM